LATYSEARAIIAAKSERLRQVRNGSPDAPSSIQRSHAKACLVHKNA
jgi:hypothetical protein